MRRALVGMLLAISVLAVGATSAEPPAPGPGKAFTYLPARGVVVAALPTDLHSERFRTVDNRVVRRLVGIRIEPFIEDRLDDVDLSYDRDVRPQLGNEMAVGVRWGTFTSGGDGVVAALQVRDPAALERALARTRGLRSDGQARGARLYRERGSRQAFLALEDDVLVFADSERRLRRALARHDAGRGMTAESFARRLGDLPSNALVRAVGDVPPLLSQRPLRRLRRIRWARAIRTSRGTLDISNGRLQLHGALDTAASRIKDADLPVQPGEDPPALVHSRRQFAGGSVNQSQTTSFLLRAARAAFPRSRFVRDVRRVERSLHINFDREVLRQFDGPSASLLAPDGRFAARSAVRNPARMARTIRRLAPDLGRIVQDLEALQSQGLTLLVLFAPDAPVSHGVLGRSRVKVKRLRGQRNFYRLSGLSDGPAKVYFGLHRGVFVIGSSEHRAKAMARAPATKPPGIQGASVTRADLGAMRSALERELYLDPGRLGEMLGSLSSSRERLRGSLSIELR